MKMSQMFPSNYIKGDDFVGRTEHAQIERVVMEKMPEGDDKAVVYFAGRSKGWVLNVTNARMLTQAFGDDTELWRGRQIELYGTPVEFKGETRNGIRVRIPRPPMPQQPAAAPGGAAYPWQQPAAATAQAQPATPAAAPAAAGAPFDDDIKW